ncbi:MAG: hypothetical protein HOJ90_14535 [Alphaproteobacteria bacterium]|nr:hypothetical protein [Alphaproteobacteria bacterium]
MTGKVIRIERIAPRGGIVEEPEFGTTKHHAENAVYVRTLDEVAELVSDGFSLRMTGKGKRASLVSPKGLRIICG